MSDIEIPPPALRLMRTFDPTQPAILHDRLNDEIVTWVGDLGEHFMKNAEGGSSIGDRCLLSL